MLEFAAAAGQCWHVQIRNPPVSLLTDPFLPPRDLAGQLVREGLIPDGARFETLYGGRTNRVWKVLGGDADRVLKLYRPDLGNPLFRNDPGLEAQCLKALAPSGFVPRLRATGISGSDQWVFYDHAPGTPWHEGPESVAGLLSQLHGLPTKVPAPLGCNGSDDLTRHTARILGRCRSRVAFDLAPGVPGSPVPPTPHTCLIHGDPVAGNILVAPSGLTLIDWQCPLIGDPCEDLALFLSPAMQHLYRGSPLTPDEENRFLTAYGRPDIRDRFLALKPWYARRMAAYCLWRVETGSPAYQAGLELELATM